VRDDVVRKVRLYVKHVVRVFLQYLLDARAQRTHVRVFWGVVRCRIARLCERAELSEVEA